jgi:streptogramin lyase
MGQGGVTLDPGLHDIVVRYGDRTDHTYITLSWRPAGDDGSFRPIPSDFLFPPQENYAQVDVADLARFMQNGQKAVTTVAPNELDPAQVEVVASGLAQPHGVAVANGIVYVAETGNHAIVAFDESTGKEVASPFKSIDLTEPFDLAAQPDGSILVLDAGSGQVLRYDPTAGVVNAIPLSPDYASRSRGIGAGLNGELWIANTPGQKVVGVNANGVLSQSIALPSTSADVQQMQPTDVVAMEDNTLFVADVAGNQLYHFDMAGYLLSSQPIPISNSLDSAHLTADNSGGFLMTEPEDGRVVQLDSEGAIEHVWNVRTTDAPDAKPVGVAMGAEGAVWVTDSQGGRLIQLLPEGLK